MKTIYFVRHGITQSNIDNVASGSGDNPPLLSKGREQAKEAGESLGDKAIEKIICSPMNRTIETAEIIAGEIGFPVRDIEHSPLLAERSFGFYDGKKWSEYHQDVKQNDIKDTGETMEELFQRAKDIFDMLRQRPEKVILVVSHGGVGRMIRAVDRSLSHNDFHEIERFDNCEIDVFTL